MIINSHEFKQQFWHFLSNSLLTILVFVPLLNTLVVFLWAATREYYQHKNHNFTFWQNIPSFNTDLFWSCIGIIVGMLSSIGLWVWILKEVLYG